MMLPKKLISIPLLLSLTLSGCATTSTATADPWKNWNRGAQGFNDNVDKLILKPMATGYSKATPESIDESISNFFSNIDDISVFINDFLQFKVTQSGMDFGRFLFNSTFGVAGFYDVASSVKLPKHKEDFGQTLGVWGLPSGPYLVLPFFGASSVRDAFGLLGDAFFSPMIYLSMFGGTTANLATLGTNALDVTNRRANLMATENLINEASVNRYDFIRNSYLQHRNYLVYDGNPPDELDLDTNEPQN
jgi:phospholipid-binding lipoprotein MlaA